MANGSTFTSVWARCPKHQLRLLEKGEVKCLECKITERNLSLTPPFDAYCIESGYSIITAGKVYPVIWVVIDGREEYFKLKGYCIEAEDGSIFPYVFDPLKFIPVEFLTKDKKDSWLEPEAA